MIPLRAAPVPVKWDPQLSIFASDAFLKTVGHEFGWMGGIDEAGKLRCVLPYTLVRKATLRMIRFRTETIAIGSELSVDEERAFLNSTVDYFRSTKADLIIPASANALFRVCPDGAISAPYGSFVIDLRQSQDVLWSNLHAKHRNVVRNAKKKGVEVACGTEHLDAVYDLVKATLARSRLAFMKPKQFERLVSNVGENLKLFVALYQGRVHACAAIPFSTDRAYYLYGGTAPEPITGAMNLLHWEAIGLFRSLGVGHYDFMGARRNPPKGSKQEGLVMFKGRFGGEFKCGYMWKYAYRPLKYALYCLATRLRSGGDVVDQERKESLNRSGSPR